MGVSSGHAVAEGVKGSRKYEFDRCYTYHVLGDSCGGCAENACDFADALILGDLQHVNEVFLAVACKPDFRSVR